jgi:hypothetical protein
MTPPITYRAFLGKNFPWPHRHPRYRNGLPLGRAYMKNDFPFGVILAILERMNHTLDTLSVFRYEVKNAARGVSSN